MMKSSGTWYFVVSANFFDNHISPGLADRRSRDSDEDRVKKATRGRQGAAGAATTKNTVIYKSDKSTEEVKVFLQRERDAAVATNPTYDAEGKCTTEFTTKATYRIITVNIAGDASSRSPSDVTTVEQAFKFSIAKYPDKKVRIVHFAGAATAAASGGRERK
jgi:hypothetical protein